MSIKHSLGRTRTFAKIKCKHCGRMITGYMMTQHQAHCKPAIEARSRAKLDSIKTRPVKELTYGEAKESGRLEEFLAAARSEA